MLTLYLLFFIHPSKKIKIIDFRPPNAIFLRFIWVILLIYLLYILVLSYLSGGFSNSFHYDGLQQDPFKTKNIAYLLLFITPFLFWHSKRYFIFIPNIIIVVLDIVAGSRTIALIALIPVILSVCIYHRQLYILPALVLLVGMSVLGVIRTDEVLTEVPWYINMMGEFRETYLTLPLYINNEEYVGKAGFINALAGLSLGVLQPLRHVIMESITFAGIYMANDIDRGYGLGSNLLIEGLYHGYLGLLITLLLFFLMLILSYRLISNVRVYYAIFIMSLLVIVFRLVIREGLYTSVGLMLLVALFYCLPLYYISKMKVIGGISRLECTGSKHKHDKE